MKAVLGQLPAGCQLAVDANGRFDQSTALAYGKALSVHDLSGIGFEGKSALYHEMKGLNA
jgi:L-alanine-DL-glutamate epimerase-like enolase superfamily enzyme